MTWSGSSSTPWCCGPTCRGTRSSLSCWAGSGSSGWRRWITRTCRSSGWSRTLAPDRSLARHPLFQVTLTVQNNAPAAGGLPGLRAAAVPAGTGAARFDLDIAVAGTRDAEGRPGDLRGMSTVAADLFDAADGAGDRGPVRPGAGGGGRRPRGPAAAGGGAGCGGAGAGRWQAGTTPRRRCRRGAVRSCSRRRRRGLRMRSRWSCGDGCVTYAELDARANRLARVLAARGAGPETVVAVAAGALGCAGGGAAGGAEGGGGVPAGGPGRTRPSGSPSCWPTPAPVCVVTGRAVGGGPAGAGGAGGAGWTTCRPARGRGGRPGRGRAPARRIRRT